MTIDALSGVLLIPALSAGLLAALPGYRLTSRLNVLAAFLTFATAASLFVIEPASGRYLLVDDLNKVFIVLTTFVAFTTSVFSASVTSASSASSDATANAAAKLYSL